MENKQLKFGNFSDTTTKFQSNNFASVYYYLLAGISLLISVFLFLPRVSTG